VADEIVALPIDRSKAVMVMVIVRLLLAKIIGCRAGKLSRQTHRD
jgi:hypothetical protein